MYVKRVFYDDLKDLSNVEKSIEFPTWEDVEKVINLLDGEYVTQITMDNGNETDCLCIGGGGGMTGCVMYLFLKMIMRLSTH